MNKVTFFTVGETYTNDQIRFSLDLENLGGIRPSLDSDRTVRHIAIMTAAEDSGKLQIENGQTTTKPRALAAGAARPEIASPNKLEREGPV